MNLAKKARVGSVGKENENQIRTVIMILMNFLFEMIEFKVLETHLHRRRDLAGRRESIS